MTMVDDRSESAGGPEERAPYHAVHENALTDQTLAMLRSVISQTLGRRGAMSEGERDKKWWVSLEDLRKKNGDELIGQIITPVVRSPAVQAAMAAVGDDPVAILQYCIFRRFDPQRNPVPAQWHFDANILGLKTQMINTWCPLVDVGETAPGLTVVKGARRPQALWQRMVDIADENGMFNAKNRPLTLIANEDVEAAVEADPEAEYVTPIIPAGGAIQFDHLYLHGTQKFMPEMGARESFEFRVMSERVARQTGLARQWAMVKLH